MPPSRGLTLRHDAEHQFGVGDVGAADGVAADSLTLLRHGAAHLPGITDGQTGVSTGPAGQGGGYPGRLHIGGRSQIPPRCNLVSSEPL